MREGHPEGAAMSDSRKVLTPDRLWWEQQPDGSVDLEMRWVECGEIECVSLSVAECKRLRDVLIELFGLPADEVARAAASEREACAAIPAGMASKLTAKLKRDADAMDWHDLDDDELARRVLRSVAAKIRSRGRARGQCEGGAGVSRLRSHNDQEEEAFDALAELADEFAVEVAEEVREVTGREKRIAEVRGRLANATPGPWKVQPSTSPGKSGRCDGVYAGDRYDIDTRIVETDGGYYPPRLPDAELIAHAPTDIEWLLGEVERLTRAYATGCQAGAAAEREACAELAESGEGYYLNTAALPFRDESTSHRIAELIRARRRREGGDE